VWRDGASFAIVTSNLEGVHTLWFYRQFTLRLKPEYTTGTTEMVVPDFHNQRGYGLPDSTPRCCASAVGGPYMAFAYAMTPEVEIRVRHIAHPIDRARITLEGATTARLRLAGDTLTICDDRGRVIVVDVARGTVVHDFRTR
jgi:hypothetical protein